MPKLRGHDSFLLDAAAMLGVTFAEIGSDLWEECAGALRSRRGSHGRVDAMTARKHHDTAALQEALDDPRQQLLAATFLAQLSCYEASEKIARLLDSESVGIRCAAVQALGELDGWAYRDKLR